MFSSILGCGILVFSLYAIKSNGAILAFSVLYGVCTGGIIALQPACVAQITPDTRIIGIKIGLMMALSSLGYVGPCLIVHQIFFLYFFSNRIWLIMMR
jgi:hypothetical protein